MSVREDQSSCRSVKINHHVAISDRHLSVREGQASSFVSLHQGMRLPDKQTRYRQARQQGRSQSFWIWVLRSTVSVPSYYHDQHRTAAASLEMKMARRQPAVLAADPWGSDIFSLSRTSRNFYTSNTEHSSVPSSCCWLAYRQTQHTKSLCEQQSLSRNGPLTSTYTT